MAGGGGGAEAGEPEFQVAPMIDVLLTILVFFMTITSAQVLKVDKTIQLPIAKDAQKKDNTRAEAILNVRWKLPARKAQFVLNDHIYTNATEMIGPLKRRALRARKKSRPAPTRPSAPSSGAIAMCLRFTFPRQ
ncbi:MAG: biopolymer transporter ExbD [Chthoniobacterales bacterium]